MSLSEYLYKNIGVDKESIERDIAVWCRQLVKRGRMSQYWNIKDMMINVTGSVDMRGEVLKYPFNWITGEFLCDESEKTSPNYPRSVYNKKGILFTRPRQS